MQIAHIRNKNNVYSEQSVYEHCRKTAEYASQSLINIGLDQIGLLVGWLHDMGKCKEQMRKYLTDASEKKEVHRGSVNHTFAGVIYLMERYHKNDCSGYRELTCEIAAYAIGAHHGLFDCVSELSSDGFKHRLNVDREEIRYDESLKNFLAECIDENQIDILFEKATAQTECFIKKAMRIPDLNNTSRDFIFGITARIVLSALIDADRRDTSEFMNGIWETGKSVNTEYWDEQLSFTERKISSFKCNSQINKARKDISDMCYSASERECGIYRLTVPTGSGKTLASLRYAQAHAKRYGKSRIFYVIPLLSVIEQNAAVWTDYIIDPKDITEHHSNVIESRFGDGETDKYESINISWKSPYVITTMVQLLNSLFSGKTDALRRVNALTDSVIIIDEIQTLPLKTLYIFNIAMNFLSSCCNTTIIMCSATQPCFDRVNYPLNFVPSPEIVPYSNDINKIFHRSDVVFSEKPSGYSAAEISNLVSEQAEERKSILIICNTKRTAYDIYKSILSSIPEDTTLFYLSTSLCTKHRINTLDKIKKHLSENKRIICVSTQLIEAGVDISFSCVIRIVAGLDSIAQGTGRCNRNGELFPLLGHVIIIPYKNENLSRLQDISFSQIAFYEFLSRFNSDKEKLNNNILSAESIDLYYKRFYSLPGIKNHFRYPLPEHNTDLLTLLADNRDFINNNVFLNRHYALHQAFDTAGKLFSVFDNDTTDVIVPYDDTAERIISDIQSRKSEHDLKFLWDTVRKARSYTVSLFSYQIKLLREKGAIYDYAEGHIHCLMANYYDKNTLGIIMDSNQSVIL